MSENTPETESSQPEVDMYWLVANIFALIHIIEDKFGAETVEYLVQTATLLERAMREEAAGKE